MDLTAKYQQSRGWFFNGPKSKIKLATQHYERRVAFWENSGAFVNKVDGLEKFMLLVWMGNPIQRSNCPILFQLVWKMHKARVYSPAFGISLHATLNLLVIWYPPPLWGSCIWHLYATKLDGTTLSLMLVVIPWMKQLVVRLLFYLVQCIDNLDNCYHRASVLIYLKSLNSYSNPSSWSKRINSPYMWTKCCLACAMQSLLPIFCFVKI